MRRKVAFFGSPEFAIPVLNALVAQHEVVLVVTQPDKPVGRKLQLTPPAVAIKAKELNIPLTQPERLRKNPEFAKLLKDCGAEVAITCAYGKILPAGLLTIPKYGFLNTHTSLLPKYRGAAPIQWALINGETVTGTTIMQTDAGMDTGDIVLQEELPILPEWKLPELSLALSQQSSRLIVQALHQLDQLSPIPQNHALASYAPMLNKEAGQIHWTHSARDIYNRYRGLWGYVGSYTFLHGKRLKVLDMQPRDGNAPAGQITAISEQGLWVGTGDGLIELITVQPENKPAMSALTWFKNFQIRLQDKFQSDVHSE